MISVQHWPLRVYSNPPALRVVVADDCEPFISPEDTQGYCPTPAEEAYWAAFTLARSGESARCDRWVSAEVGQSWSLGTMRGNKAREEADAYELGYELGLRTGISEPPTGFADHEKAAYRRGFAAALIELDESERIERLWQDEIESERMELAFGFTLTDADIHPVGCWS